MNHSFLADDLPLVPYPKRVERREGFFDLGNGGIVYEVYDTGASFMAEQIAGRCAEVSGLRPRIALQGSEFDFAVRYDWVDSLPEEAYTLTISRHQALIRASGKRGRWYGAMTLCQLIGADGTVPCVNIEDEPDYRIRAISDDISRGQVSSIEHFKRIIRFCSEYKINTYFLYIEDLLQFRTNKRIGVGRGGLTIDEVRELADYASDWQVDLAPLFESLGHQDVMVTMPEYAEFREGEGSFSFVPADPRTLRLMEDFYRELAGTFSSPIVFAGLDETTDIGSGRSKEALEKYGHARIYADYYNGLNRIAKKFGKQLWIYATLAIDFPESLDWIDKDIVMVNYTFSEPDSGEAWWDNLYTYLPVLIEKGFTEVVSPSLINWKRVYPDYSWAYRNTSTLNQIGFENGCIGSMCASWADEGGENFREYNWYGYALQSELTWNAGNKTEQGTLAHRFGASFFGPGLERLGSALHSLGQVEEASGGTFEILYGKKAFAEPFEPERCSQVQRARSHLDEFAAVWYEGNRNPAVKRNAEFVPYVDFACRRARFVLGLPGRSDRVLERLDLLKSLGDVAAEEEAQNEIVRELDDMHKQLRQFRLEFEALWRRACRIEGLDRNLARMDAIMKRIEVCKDSVLKRRNSGGAAIQNH